MIIDDKIKMQSGDVLVAMLGCPSCGKESLAFPDFQRGDHIHCKHCEAALSENNLKDWISVSNEDIQFYADAGMLEFE